MNGLQRLGGGLSGGPEYPQTLDAREPVRLRLEHEKAGLVKRVSQIEKALSLLERNPDIEELLNII